MTTRLAPPPSLPPAELGTRRAGADGSRLLHPAAQHVVGTLSEGSLTAIVTGLAAIRRSVPVGPGQPPGAPRSLRLVATDAYDVWLITWPPGSGIGLHDHGEARGVLRLVDGQLVEVFTDQPGTRPTRARILGAGDLSAVGRGAVHDLWNAGEGDATSLHAYSPPLAEVTFFDHTTRAGLEARRTASVDAPEAEASGPAAAAPATLVGGGHPPAP